MKAVTFLHKEIITINEDLRIYKYIYKSGVALYFTPRSEELEVIKVWIGLEEINRVLKEAGVKPKAS